MKKTTTKDVSNAKSSIECLQNFPGSVKHWFTINQEQAMKNNSFANCLTSYLAIANQRKNN